MAHRYGWKPSLPGVLATAADTTGLAVKPEVDPRNALPPIFDQGQLGSCTANATAAAFEYDAHLDGRTTGRLSRLWIYYYERAIEGSLGQGDTGAFGSDAFKVASIDGICAETYWPYKIAKFQNEPSAKAKSEATYHLTKPTHLVAQSESAFKRVLSNNQTIAFGFTVYESFEDDSRWSRGEMPIPIKGESVLGGHEVLMVGYIKAAPGFMLCRNSWGTSWQELGGYFLFPTAELVKRSVCSDFRTIVRSL